MAQSVFPVMLRHSPGGGGEGRVHQHGAGHNLRWEHIVNNLAVEVVRLEAKLAAEQEPAPVVQFVADDARSHCTGPDCEAARSRRWLKDKIARLDIAHPRSQHSIDWRRRELLTF